MNAIGVIVIFIIWWWIAFLALLPTGVKGRWEQPDDHVRGADPGAPETPDIKKKAFRATIASVALTVITSVVILSGVIDFRE